MVAVTAKLDGQPVTKLTGRTPGRGSRDVLRAPSAALVPSGSRVLALSALYGFLGEPQRGVDVLAEVRHHPRGLSLWSFVDTPDRDPLRTLPSFQQLMDEIRPRETAP